MTHQTDFLHIYRPPCPFYADPKGLVHKKEWYSQQQARRRVERVAALRVWPATKWRV